MAVIKDRLKYIDVKTSRLASVSLTGLLLPSAPSCSGNELLLKLIFVEYFFPVICLHDLTLLQFPVPGQGPVVH